MNMNVRLLLLLSPLALAAGADAQNPPRPLANLFACSEIAEDAARLTCLDTAVAALQRETAAGDVVAVDRGQIEAAEEATFGLTIPNFSLPRIGGMGGSSDELAAADRDSANADRVVVRNDDGLIERIEGLAVTGLEVDRVGKAVITLANGQRWRQTDSTNIFRVERGVQDGMTAAIRSGALSSYFMRLSTSSRWFRAERTN